MENVEYLFTHLCDVAARSIEASGHASKIYMANYRQTVNDNKKVL